MEEHIILAALGGLIYCLFPIIELATKPIITRPDFRNFWFFIQFVFYPLLGAILMYVYYESPEIKITRMIALNTGLFAPMFFRQAVVSSQSIKRVSLTDENQ